MILLTSQNLCTLGCRSNLSCGGCTDLLFCRESGVWSNLVTRKEEVALSDDTKSTVNIPILIVYKYIELFESCHVRDKKLCILCPSLFLFFLPISAI